jgi:hypothetical protein
MRKMSKAVRIRRMLSRGASTGQIVKALGCSKQYVYTVHSRMKKEIQDRIAAYEIINAKTGITPQPLPEYLNSIQGEYSKHKEMTTWQRFKAAVGF